ncbi:MAG TPA: hypothetical protein VFZ33_14180 [Chitinophagaceae bacterium]
MKNQTIKKHDPDSLLIHYLTLRKSVGLLGILLPLVLIFGVKFITNCNILQDSISDYYYTKMGHYMTGTLCAVSLFMFSYRGYGPKDLWAGRSASVFALCVAFFPCSNYHPLSECKVLELKGNDVINLIHFGSAACLFLILSFFCLFLFTKSSGHPTNRKKQRNVVYKICGIIILVSIILIFLYSVIPAVHELFKAYKPIFWLETLSLLAFGFSWLTKGEGLLPDKK